MQIIPMSPNIQTIEAVDRVFGDLAPLRVTEPAEETGDKASFIDVLTGLWDQTVELQSQKSEDMANIMLGDTQNLEQIQINIAKAEVATELFVNIKNAVVDAYNEIMRMSI